MDKDVEVVRRAVENWYLGKTSARFESSSQGAGVISTGAGDHGGVSYGTYQLSSKMGTLREYLDQSRYRTHFEALQPATPAFDAKWRELARTDPGFARDQHDFVGRTHYGKQVERLNAIGIDLSERGRAVQDLAWSTSVQFGNMTPGIFQKGLAEKFGPDYEFTRLSDRDIVDAVQEFKINHNSSLFRSSPAWQPGLLKRAHAERVSLIELAEQENLLVAHGVTTGGSQSQGRWAQRVGESAGALVRDRVSVQKYGSRGGDVRALQEQLSALGYGGSAGKPLAVDGEYGEQTRHAVRCFQEAHGLVPDGIAGRNTRLALDDAERRPLLSERPHADALLFHEAKRNLRIIEGVCRTEAALDRAAGALAATAKLQGFSHIDHVVLNTRVDGLICVQGGLEAPDRRVASIEKSTAISQSLQQSTDQLTGQRVAQDESVQARVRMEHMEHRSGPVVGVRP